MIKKYDGNPSVTKIKQLLKSNSEIRNAFFQDGDEDFYIKEIVNLENLTFISYGINKKDILGIISFCFDNINNHVFAVSAVSFSKDMKSKLIFGRDLYRSFYKVAKGYDIVKIGFSASVENPILENYKKIVKKYKGRKCGVFKRNILKENGEYVDEIFFEIETKKIIKHKIKGDKNELWRL